MNELN